MGYIKGGEQQTTRKGVRNVTIGAWVIVGVIASCGLLIAGLSLFWAMDFERTGKIVCRAAAAAIMLVTVALCGVYIWYRNNSESGRRALRDQESNLTGGIERTVSVYDINGNLIKEYAGRFDIETDHASYILFDDENGDRHMIYYTTGTIIIDEH